MFKPTYLYIKQHSVTGKLYFGKTVRDPIKYKGSGIHWVRHYTKHGKEHIVTLWYCLFYDRKVLNKFAIQCSRQWDIVESPDWLNKITENGLDERTGVTLSEETKRKIGDGNRGKVHDRALVDRHILFMTGRTLSEDHRQKISKAGKLVHASGNRKIIDYTPEMRYKLGNSSRGKAQSEETKKKRSATLTGMKRTVESKERIKEAASKRPHSHYEGKTFKCELRTCPHCGTVGGGGVMTRYHFTNCKTTIKTMINNTMNSIERNTIHVINI